MNRFVGILLIVMAIVVLVVLTHRGDNSILGLSGQDLGWLLYTIGLLTLVSGSALLLFRENFTRAAIALLAWIGIGLVLALGYTYRFELRDAGDRMLSEFLPGRAYSKGRVVEIARGRMGEFRLSAMVNGTRVPMALDTGASSVVLTHEAAKAAGLPLEVLAYNVNVDTANGRTRAAAITLDRVGVGGVVERAVPALIAQPGQLKINLLGMSFLNRLESWEVRGDRLIMRGYP